MYIHLCVALSVCLSLPHTHTYTPSLYPSLYSFLCSSHSASVCLSVCLSLSLSLTHTHTLSPSLFLRLLFLTATLELDTVRKNSSQKLKCRIECHMLNKVNSQKAKKNKLQHRLIKCFGIWLYRYFV